MPSNIISDTSCLILLANIGELNLLEKIYGKVITTQEVASEFGETLPAWVEIVLPVDETRQKILELQLDHGEASAIALALELHDCTIILDDYKARTIAEKLGLRVTGTLGVLIKAKTKGVVPSIKPIIENLITHNFYFSEELVRKVLRESGE